MIAESTIEVLAGVLSVTVIRGTLVFAAAGAVTALARRLSSGVRHLVWLAVILSFLLIPLAWMFLPALHIGPGLSRGPAADWRLAAAPVLSRLEYTRVIERTSVGSVLSELPPALPVQQIGLGLLCLWAAGSLFLSARLLVGAARLRRLARQGFTDSRLQGLTAQIAAVMGVRRRFRVILSPRCSMPFSFGAFSPAVVLPAEAGGWTAERLRPVLTHELAHIHRRDVLTQSAAYAVCILFWFIPPLWLAYSALLREAEISCDQHVIDAGIRGPGYASCILELARSCRGRMLLPSISAAAGRRRVLAQRIKGILTLTPARRRFRLREAARVLAVCLCCLLPVLAVFGGAQSLPLARDDPLFGTWANREYDAGRCFCVGRIVIGRDGRVLEYRHITDSQPAKEEWKTITKSWMDAAGARWYQMRIVEWEYPGRSGKIEGFALTRISGDGGTLESCFAQYGFPKDVTPLGPGYGIWHRQR
jgi:beta-lactamase regulating signal transducer with metallopeptidase domain